MHELSLTWRSRARIAAGCVGTFAAGVIAATSGAGWFVRAVGAALFLLGVYVVLDAVVFASSWRMTGAALKIPTLASRHREVAGREDLAVELHESVWSQLGITGPNGVRLERVNPLISGRDLRRWWDSLPDD